MAGQSGNPLGWNPSSDPSRDERRIVFERAAGARQINPAVATSAAAFVKITLRKVTPTHVCTEVQNLERERLLTPA